MRDIEGFGGNYLIDENGNVFSKYTNKYLSQRFNNQGYKLVDLFYKNNRKQSLVHRLVAKTFLDNSQNYPCVNHIDFNKTNNNVNNLEWCSYLHNIKHSKIIEKMNNSTKKKVKQIKNNKIIAIYDSRMEAERKTGINNANISECCNNIRKSAGGFKWING